MKKALLIDLFALPEYDISLALGYLKAYSDADAAVKGAWDIRLLHLPVATPAGEVAAAVAREAPDLVGFSCYSWNIRAVERAVGQLPSTGRPLVIMGGIEVTPDPVGYLQRNPKADVVVFGEGEETFRELLAKFRDAASAPAPKHADGVAGVCWRDGRSVRRSAPRPPFPDLSVVPSPYLSGTYGDLLKDQDRVMVETARGCPYSCTFCFEPRGFAKTRTFPKERVKEELAKIVASGVREVAFLDTNFNMDRKRAVELWDYLATLGGNVRYAFELRGELIDEAQARSISALDYFVEIGLQSIHQKSLKAVKRWYEPKRFADGIRALLAAGVYRPCAASGHGGVGIDLMMGLPHETVDDVLSSFDFVLALNPSSVILTMTKILPGTELYDDRKKFHYDYDPDAQYELTGNEVLTRTELKELALFRDAVDFAYNRLHAVRTMSWVAEGLKRTPGRLFLEVGRRMAAAKRDPASLGVDDLAEILAAIAKEEGVAAIADRVDDRLAAENLLNALQRRRETKRSWWNRTLFRAGHWFLETMGKLPPLPKPPSVAESTEKPFPAPELAASA
jgi:radical SAM superfamily enzyme YgiQ (UPF0313 family)